MSDKKNIDPEIKLTDDFFKKLSEYKLIVYHEIDDGGLGFSFRMEHELDANKGCVMRSIIDWPNRLNEPLMEEKFVEIMSQHMKACYRKILSDHHYKPND